MFRKVFTKFFLVMLVLCISVIAGNKKLDHGRTATAEDDAAFFDRLKDFTNTASTIEKLPNELGRTWYDYPTNQQLGRTIAHAYDNGTDGIHFNFMKVLPQGAERYVTYDYWDSGLELFYGNQSITEAMRTGWGRIVNGKNDEVIIAHHGGGLHLWQDASEFGYSFTELVHIPGVSDCVFPGIARLGDTVVLITQQDNANWFGGDTIIVSTDYMQTWTGHNIAPFDPGTTDGGAEYQPSINPANPTEFSYIFSQDCSAVTSTDGSMKLATTTDLGATWTTQVIYDDGTITADSAVYYIENFSQANGMYTSDGNYHVVMGSVQGYEHYNLSTIQDAHPILYWSTNEGVLKELTSEEKGHPADTTVLTVLRNNYPRNAIGGNTNASLSEGPNGELVCIWSQWEDDGAGGIITVTPTGGASPFFCSDIWGAYSPDGGLTWSDPFFVAGTAGEADVYPYITKDFFFNAAADSIILDVAYLWDTNVGCSVGSPPNSDVSECVWYYEQVAIPDPFTNIDEDENIAREINLFQNYPNPFNPATEIKFNISKTADVTLEVFNVIGEKVATLIKGKKAAGEHSASFSGADFSSGVYFYQLTAGDFIQTKKMLLVK